MGNAIVDKEIVFLLYRTMTPIPIDLDCIWNYSFCELMGLGVEIDEDWYSVGNI